MSNFFESVFIPAEYRAKQRELAEGEITQTEMQQWKDFVTEIYKEAQNPDNWKEI